MRKIIIIGQCEEKNHSGPDNIIRNLIAEYKKENLNFEKLLLNKEISKWKYVIKLNLLLKNNRNSLVNIHQNGYLLPLLVLLLQKIYRSHSYYLTVHGIYKIEAPMTGNVQRMYVMLERILLRHFPNIVCVSEMLRDNLKKIFNRSDNIIVIPNGTDADSSAEYKCSRIKEIISLGGLRKRKGIDDIIELGTTLKEHSKEWHISIYGSSENREDWFERTIIKYGLENYISYRGELSNKQDVYDIIKKADAQLCLSRYDTFNVAIAESLVLGCPCITSDMCGAGYLITNNDNGLIVNVEDDRVNGFKKIIDYIDALTVSKRLEIESKTALYKKMLSWNNVVKMYLELK